MSTIEKGYILLKEGQYMCCPYVTLGDGLRLCCEGHKISCLLFVSIRMSGQNGILPHKERFSLLLVPGRAVSFPKSVGLVR